MTLLQIILAEADDLTAESRYEREMFGDPWFTNLTERFPYQPDWQFKPAVQWAVKYLKKNNRIVWFLKWYRLHLIRDTLKATSLIHDKNSYQEKTSSNTVYQLNIKSSVEFHVRGQKLLDKYKNQIEDAQDEALLHQGTIRSRLIHYFNLHIPAIDNYSFSNQSMETVLDTFQHMEEEWVNKGGGNAVLHTDEKRFLDVGDDYAWYDLGKTYCEKEKGAMKHCATARSGATLLSLRRKVGNNLYQPVLTFELINGNTLGQMKGRANTKPDPKYFKYIIPLLKDGRIRSIWGGGYRAENNFSISDLPQSDQQWFLDHKPDLVSIELRIIQTPHLTQSLADELFHHYFHSLSVNVAKEWFYHPKIATGKEILNTWDFDDEAINECISRIIESNIFVYIDVGKILKRYYKEHEEELRNHTLDLEKLYRRSAFNFLNQQIDIFCTNLLEGGDSDCLDDPGKDDFTYSVIRVGGAPGFYGEYQEGFSYHDLRELIEFRHDIDDDDAIEETLSKLSIGHPSVDRSCAERYLEDSINPTKIMQIFESELRRELAKRKAT